MIWQAGDVKVRHYRVTITEALHYADGHSEDHTFVSLQSVIGGDGGTVEARDMAEYELSELELPDDVVGIQRTHESVELVDVNVSTREVEQYG